MRSLHAWMDRWMCGWKESVISIIRLSTKKSKKKTKRRLCLAAVMCVPCWSVVVWDSVVVLSPTRQMRFCYGVVGHIPLI